MSDDLEYLLTCVEAHADKFPVPSHMRELVARIRAALPKGEPVAWRWRAQSKTGMWTGWHDGRAPEPGRYKVYDGYTLHEQPLFAYGEPMTHDERQNDG